VGARTLDSASPSFGFHAGIHDALNLYANLTTAFETPTAGELSTRPDGGRGFNPELEPQVGITTEVGGRGMVASQLAWEAVFFHTTLHNELVPYEVASDPGRRYFRNSGTVPAAGLGGGPPVQSLPVLQHPPRGLHQHGPLQGILSGGGTGLCREAGAGAGPVPGEAMIRLGPGSWFAELRGEATGAIPGNDMNTPEAESPAYRLMDVRAGANEVNILGFDSAPSWA
jgi:hypothetical protein